MDWKKYSHIERLGTDEVEGILNGEVYIFPKLDGTNTGVHLDDEGNVQVNSSKRLLTVDNDNAGACAYVLANEKFKKYLQKHPNHYLYGEFLIKNTIRYYEDDAWNKLYIFDVVEYDGDNTRYLTYDEYVPLLEEFDIEYIPCMITYTNPSEDDVIATKDECTFLTKNVQAGEGCFGRNTRILMADGTYKKIIDVKVGDYVKSYNVKTKVIENKKVLTVFDNGVKPFDDWYRVTVNCKMLCTEDKAFNITKTHKIFNGKSFVPIKDTNVAYMYEKVPDTYRRQAILGILCSDGCYYMAKGNARISISQLKEKSYSWMNALRGFITNPYQHISGKGSTMFTYTVKRKYVDELIGDYKDGNTLDFVKIFNDLDNIGWAFVFMGDGSSHGLGALDICLASYSYYEVEKIKDIFNKRFNTDAYLYFDKRVTHGSGATLRITKRNASKFVSCVGKYILADYRYKLRDYVDIVYEDVPKYKTQYALVPKYIYNKGEESTMSKARDGRYKGIHAYDLEVEDNHNYFAENMLVHNCVVKRFDFTNKYGRTVWAKIVRSEFKHKAKLEKSSCIEQQIVDEFCTPAFIEKEYLKLVTEKGWNSKLIPQLLGTIWHTLIAEECWNIVKKYKSPTIDFRLLNKLVVDKIKEVKSNAF